jgi:serine/threonine protein kinase
MTLAAGSRLGGYEILAPLGAGGMGEVYRALDAKLGREIAVKVLPAGVSADQSRRGGHRGQSFGASGVSLLKWGYCLDRRLSPNVGGSGIPDGLVDVA